MRIAILAYEGCVASGVSGFSDVLAVANHTLQQERFKTTVLSEGGQAVHPFSGPPLAVDAPLDDDERWDVVYIPPAFGVTQAPEVPATWVKQAHKHGATACAACAGVFFLAEAGVLNERPATTHWGLVEEFAKQFPSTPLAPERMLIDGGDYICAGGLTAFFDLALHITARFTSSEIALSCAKTLLLDPGRVRQTPYMNLIAPPTHGDEPVIRAQEWLEERHTRPVRVKELAKAVHLGQRTLLRRFKKATGRTPGGYLQALRIEHAKRLLESGTSSVEEIFQTVGYQDGPAFFRAFKELTGLTPGGYRARFGVRG